MASAEPQARLRWRKISNGYDLANRVMGVSGIFNNQTVPYVSVASFWPHGATVNSTYGNQLTHTNYSFNERLQPTALWDAFGDSDNSYVFRAVTTWGAADHDNGNLSAITTFAGTPTPSAQLHGFTQSFTYDGVNRLTSVTDSGYGPGLTRQFAYDQYGNMTASEGTAHLDALTPVTGQNAIDPLTNRLRSGNIDAAGNQQAFGRYAVVYDAEDRQSVVADASSGTQYVYDGLGQR